MSEFLTTGNPGALLPSLKIEIPSHAGYADTELDGVEANKIRARLLDLRSDILAIGTSGGGSTALDVTAEAFGAQGDGVTNDAPAIQAALDAAKAAGARVREVYVPAGVFAITAPLTVGSNTRLTLDPGATIKRAADIGVMLVNDSAGTVGGYGANENIEVTGGTWDANGTGFATNSGAIAFGHARNVTIRNTTIRDVYGWHHVELNAVSGARVEGVQFLSFVVGSRLSEALQLDAAISSAAWPWFGPYDNTPCTNIRVAGNLFKDQSRGIGSHASVAGVRHTDIHILNNRFEANQDQAIYFINWQDVEIRGNHFTNCGFGVFADSDTVTLCDGFVVAGNTFADFATYNPLAQTAVRFAGLSTHRTFRRGAVVGNVIRNMGANAILIEYGDGWSVSGNAITTVGSLAANAGVGVWLSRCNHSSATGNSIEGAYLAGIALPGTTDCTVSGNTIRNSGLRGIWSYAAATRATIVGNSVSESGNDGMLFVALSESIVHGNLIVEGGRAATNTYSGIFLTDDGSGGSDRNSVQGNKVRSTSGNRFKYGISVDLAVSDANLVTNNDLLNSALTSSFNSTGTGTITTAGNRL